MGNSSSRRKQAVAALVGGTALAAISVTATISANASKTERGKSALAAGGIGRPELRQDNAAAPNIAANPPDTLPSPPMAQGISQPQTVADFNGPMLTGVTVSREGRVFVNYPHWGDRVPFTVAEVRNGRAVAYPNKTINNPRPNHQSEGFVSVQSVVIDPRNRLWVLDTGSVQFNPVKYGGPKLVCVDLRTNRVVKKILFPSSVALPTTYLNDIRFDLRRGRGGMAFITDSSDKGPNAIIVVDLASGASYRRLNNHPSTKAEPNWKPLVEGQPLMQRKPGKPPRPMKMGSDGIAISADGKTLYYCPLAGRHLYSVSVDALANPKLSNKDVAATVQDFGEKPGGSDGLETDAQNRLYATDYEHHSVVRRTSGGEYETVAVAPKYYWPDTLSVASNGYLYFTANGLHRQPSYHNGKDLRVKPYKLYRVRIGANPVVLK